jgi:hypothetical protein
VPEYAGFTAASKLFSFRTSQAAQAAKEAEAGMDPVDIAAEFAAAASRPPAEAAAASGPDAAARNKEKVKDQAVRPAATTAAAEGGASGAPKLAQPVRSFRLSFEDVRQEETLEEELDDTLRSASSLSAGALEGSKSGLTSLVGSLWGCSSCFPVSTLMGVSSMMDWTRCTSCRVGR